MAGVVVLVGCWPVVQSQPPEAIAPASTATAAPKPAAKPTAAAAKPAPTAAPKPTTAQSPAASTKPAAKPSPAASKPAGSPVAVVATSVAGLPAVGASPAVSTDSRGATAPDTLGVATSAGAVAAANAADAEAVALCGPGAVLSTRAGQRAGKQATVAVAQVTASYQPNTRGQPTFLNDAPYPNHVFTAVVWGNVRRQFQSPPESWQGKALCVTGPVELYQQRPQIVVDSPSQLRAAR
ncbi:MAG: hypothetical protein AB7K36_00590 [Chloroflexota bacterium]